MKKNISNVLDSWFVSDKRNYAWLPFLRITVGLFCLVHFLALLPDIYSFTSVHGIIAPDLANIKSSPWVLNFYRISRLLGHASVNNGVITVFSIAYILALVMLIAGAFTRIAAVVAAYLHLVLVNSIILYVYGLDFFCSIALFYCVIFPVGYSIAADNLIFRQRRFPSQFANFCLLLMQVHISFAYFMGGFDKALGINWWNGESVWKAVHLVGTPRFVNVDVLAKTPVFTIVGWGTIVLESLYPVFINIKRTRKAWMMLTIAMHLSIAFFLGLYFFAAFMIILNVALFYVPYTQKRFSLQHYQQNGYDNIVRLQM